MKNLIPRYTFYKNKYGSELLIDVVELKYVKRFLAESAVHTLTYYDITFVTEGEGSFSIDNRTCQAVPGDVFFSKPGEVRNWDTSILQDGKKLHPDCTCPMNFISVCFSFCMILRWK